MFNRKSSYALNKKDPNAIVYMDANEAIIRLTREDFASEEEFLKWKVPVGCRTITPPKRRLTSTLITRLHWMSYPRKRHLFLPRMSAWSRRMTGWRKSAVAPRKVTQIRKHLTDTQFRRMWMYFVDGMTVDEIGAAEGVSAIRIFLSEH